VIVVETTTTHTKKGAAPMQRVVRRGSVYLADQKLPVMYLRLKIEL
jgi:hypothetical protein